MRKFGSASGASRDWRNGDGVIGGRNGEIAASLTADERSALEELDNGPMRRRIPSAQAERLLLLGLAELSFGHLVLTSAGRHALAAVRSR